MKEHHVPDIWGHVFESWAEFGQRFEGLAPKWKRRIELAYDWAADIHSGFFRKDGATPFFEHPKAVALILFEEVGIRDPNILIAALMHDTVEDSHFFGNFGGRMPYTEWMRTAKSRLKPVFGPVAADLILALTKPKVDGVEVKSKEDVMKKYFDNLSGNRGAILIKMADRLHNLRDTRALSKEEKEKIIKETETQYFNLFSIIQWTYPEEYRILLDKIKEAINELRNGKVS